MAWSADSERIPRPAGPMRRALVAGGVMVLGAAIGVGVGVRPSSRANARAGTPARAPEPARTPRSAGATKTPGVAPPQGPPVEIALDPDTAAPDGRSPAAAVPDGGVDAVERTHGHHHHRDHEEPAFAPDDPESYRRLGLEYESDGKTSEAVAALRRYLELAPRARDRARVARRIFDLTHADDGAVKP